jgi:integrase
VRKHSKTDVRYWRERIFKPVFSRGGVSTPAPNWAVEIQHGRQRHRWSLETANRDVAAVRAKEMFLFIQVNGWDLASAKYRPKPVKQNKQDTTLGEFLAELRSKADIKAKTFEAYARAFRTIVADIAGLPGGGRGGSAQIHRIWREKVDSVKLATITPARVQDWKRRFIARAGSDPVKQRSARISFNSFVRQAKSLFAPDLVKHLQTVQLPDLLPFTGIKFEPRQSTFYRSALDVEKLIEAACEELAVAAPKAFKIFLLAVMVGLRRREIDLLEWTAFRWEQNTIRIEPTRYFQAKREYSYADVEVDPELMELFRGYRARATGDFVIESDVKPRPGATFEHYRCTSVFERLIAWLREKGVSGANPLHSLRKEFGSQINAKHGLYAASRALRHGNIEVTAQVYIDKRERSAIGFGHLLKDDSPKITRLKQVS